LRNAQQRARLLWIGHRYHRLQILDPSLEREVADIPVGHPAPSFIVAHEAEVIAEEADPVPPDRTLPFVLEVGHPVRSLDQHGPRTRLSPGELDSVRSAEIPNSLGGPLDHRTSLRLLDRDKSPRRRARSIAKP